MTPSARPVDSRAAPSRADTVPAPARRVVDAPTRAFHWLLALSFAGAYLSADGERWRLLHVVLGYTMAGLLAFRVLYGLLGPRHVRLAALWRKVAVLPIWWRSTRAHLWPPQPSALIADARQALTLAMAVAVAALMLIIVPLVASGVVFYHDWAGEWLAEFHEWLGEAMLMLVLAHLALLAVISIARRQNAARPMLTGYIPGRGPDVAKHNHAWLAIVLIVAVLSYWVWEW